MAPARSDWVKALRGFAGAHFPRDPRWAAALWAGVIFIAGTLLLSASLTPRHYDLRAGQVSPQTIAAPRTVVDRAETAKNRQAAAAQVPDQYEIDPQTTSDADAAVAAVFAVVRQTASAQGTSYSARASSLAEACSAYGISLGDSAIAAALNASAETVDHLESQLRSIVQAIMQAGVKREYLDAARGQADRRVAELGLTYGESSFLRAVADVVIVPNMVFNAAETQAKREQAMAAVPPVEILKGQVIVRAGDVVSEEQIAVLEDLGLLRNRPAWGALFGICLVLALLVGAVGLYLYLFDRELLLDPRQLSLLGLLTLMTVVLAGAARGFSGYAVPVAAGTMLIAILLNVRLAVFVSFVLGPFVGLLLGNDLRFALVALAGGLGGAFAVSRLGQRAELMRAGLLVAGANVAAIAAVDSLGGQGLFDLATLRDALWGAGNGLVSAVLTIGSLPFLEDIFGVLTSVKLLELANPNRPLLHKLLMEAPGTYHHSIIVGNLAEAAVAEVGGNAALVRVGAYYHDIGKAKRPFFFVENQFGGDNPHDKIAPSLSALIITSHVRDGVAMAEEAGLPQEVVDLIQQHHGNSLVSYFYTRATENGDAEHVVEADFRYDGPRPRTREAAILMLADACEAAVRSLTKATPGRIEGLVRKITKDRLDDGQLEDSPLTLQDLTRIAGVFSRVLAGTFHRRVEYPDWVFRELRARGGKVVGKTLNGKAANGKAVNGRAADGRAPNGKAPNGGSLRNGEKRVV